MAIPEQGHGPITRHWADRRPETLAFKEGVLRQFVEHCQAQEQLSSGGSGPRRCQLATFVDSLDKTPHRPRLNVTVLCPQEATTIGRDYAIEESQAGLGELTRHTHPANSHDGTLICGEGQAERAPLCRRPLGWCGANNLFMAAAVSATTTRTTARPSPTGTRTVGLPRRRDLPTSSADPQ